MILGRYSQVTESVLPEDRIRHLFSDVTIHKEIGGGW
jgi:hypothetical protein